MNISPGEEIAGFPAIKLRNFFRKFGADLVNVSGAAFYLGVSPRKAKKIMIALENEEYLKSEISRYTGKREIWWKQTIKGAGLRMASAAPQIKRSTADRLLSQLLIRVNEINGSDKFLYAVEKVIVFGSYLDETRLTLGDIDIAVELQPKEQNPKKLLELSVAQADEDGRRHESHFFKMTYVQDKVLKYLRNRSRGISLHTTLDGVLKTGISIKVVFTASETKFEFDK